MPISIGESIKGRLLQGALIVHMGGQDLRQYDPENEKLNWCLSEAKPPCFASSPISAGHVIPWLAVSFRYFIYLQFRNIRWTKRYYSFFHHCSPLAFSTFLIFHTIPGVVIYPFSTLIQPTHPHFYLSLTYSSVASTLFSSFHSLNSIPTTRMWWKKR